MQEARTSRGSVMVIALAVVVVMLLLGAASSSAATPPSILGESAVGVTEHDATLGAQINPNGLETSYQFRLESGCPVSGLSCLAITVYPLSAGSIPASSESQNVSLDLNTASVTLQAGEEYRYSVTATNTAGPAAEGPPQIFTTPSGSIQPSIVGESVSGVTEHDATLEAQISPNGSETDYEFQIDTNGGYDYTRPACPFGDCEAIIVGEPLPPGLVEPQPESIPAASGNQSVSLDLASTGTVLQPGTTYHYRVIASNDSALIVTGPDQIFSTPSGPGPIPLGAQSPGGGVQPLSAVQSPPRHRKHHRRHKRGPHRNSLH